MRYSTHSLRNPRVADRSARFARIAVLSLITVPGAAACGNGPTDVRLGGGPRVQTFMSDSLPATGPLGALLAKPSREPAAPLAKDGLLYRAAVVPLDTALETPPMGLRIEVRVTNPTAAAVSLPVRGCTVWPEFRPTSDAAEPVWVPEGQCAQAPYTVSLEPGQEHASSFLAHDAMLSHALDDGRYYVTARFRQAHETLRLDAGSADVRLGVPGLAFHVRTQEEGGTLTAGVRVENRNARAVHLEWGHCAVGFELHRNPDLSGTPLRIEAERTCLMYLAGTLLDAGGELSAKEFSYATGASGRNPAFTRGQYHLVVALELNWRTYRFPMGVVTVR